MTGTPQGFHLYGNRLSTAYYIYNSTMGPVYLDYCDASGCLQHGEVRVGFQEYAYGASSIRWKMTAKSLHISGPAYHYEVEYWCGVNVPNKTDWTCDTHSSDADGYEAYLVEYGTGNGSHVSNYSFGSGERQYAKFPMVQTVVSFPGYPVGPVNIKFRGWDTRYYSKSPKAGITNGWLLAPATGTGD